MVKSQKQINDKVLNRINKRRAKDNLSHVTLPNYSASINSTLVNDEYRAALIDDAIEQADKDLNEMKK